MCGGSGTVQHSSARWCNGLSKTVSAHRKKGWHCSPNVFTSLQALFPCLCQIVYWAQLINASADKKIGTVYIGSKCWGANSPEPWASSAWEPWVRNKTWEDNDTEYSYRSLGLIRQLLPVPPSKLNLYHPLVVVYSNGTGIFNHHSTFLGKSFPPQMNSFCILPLLAFCWGLCPVCLPCSTDKIISSHFHVVFILQTIFQPPDQPAALKGAFTQFWA